MDKKLLVAILLACLIYLKINEGKKNYLCYCVIALVSVGLLTVGKSVEGFDGTEDSTGLADSGIKITYTAPQTGADAEAARQSGEASGVSTYWSSLTTTFTDNGTQTPPLTDSTDTGALAFIIGADPVYIGPDGLASFPVADSQTVSYKYVDDLPNLEYSTIGDSSGEEPLINQGTLNAPDGPKYLIIRVDALNAAGTWDGTTEFYIYKVTNVDPSATVAVTGKCTGNTDSSTDVDCSTTRQAAIPNAASTVGSDAVTCCVDISGKCSGNTDTSEDYACPTGYTAKPPPADGGGIESASTDTPEERTAACCDPTTVTCSSPTDKTGYNVTETSLVRGDSFSVTGTCDTDSGYRGTLTATPCAEEGGDYSLTGCSIPTCPSSPPCTDLDDMCEDDGDDGCRKKCTSISSPEPCPDDYCEEDDDGKCQDKTNYVLWIGVPVAVTLFFVFVYFKFFNKKSKIPAGEQTPSP